MLVVAVVLLVEPTVLVVSVSLWTGVLIAYFLLCPVFACWWEILVKLGWGWRVVVFVLVVFCAVGQS